MPLVDEGFCEFYLEAFVEVLVRTTLTSATTVKAAALQQQYASLGGRGGGSSGGGALLTGDSDDLLAQELQQVSADFSSALELKVGASQLMATFASVQSAVLGSKAEKKRRLAAEAITDPQSYAMRKVSIWMYINMGDVVASFPQCSLNDSSLRPLLLSETVACADKSQIRSY
jgi:hypothetical protein